MTEDTFPKHFMRFGIHSEKQFFQHPFRNSYDSIVLNGNLIAYSLKGVCSFISGLLSDKPYFIDPITHAFGHSPRYISKKQERKLVVKPAIQALADQYGNPAVKYIGKRGLNPDDFDADGILEFTKNVLYFQKSMIEKGLTATEDIKYLDVEARTPCFLVAPYFYLGANSVDTWIDLNIKFIDIAKENDDGIPLFAEILVARDAFFDNETRKIIVDKYSRCKAEGVLLWIENFSEHKASKNNLQIYRSFIEDIARVGKKIVVMYGGYYSIILQKFGISAVCHGPGYGEEREVTPVGGGIPRPNFYFPCMHTRLPFNLVIFALSDYINEHQKYYEEVCGCTICKDVIGNDFLNNFPKYGESKWGIRKDNVEFEYATTAAKKIAIGHYIFNKEKEFNFVLSNTVNEIKKKLSDEYDFCRMLFGVNEAAHLRAWCEAL